MLQNPTKFVVRSGGGISKTSVINAVDKAMLDAGVGDVNMIKISSVLPKDIEKVEEIPEKIGAFRPCVISKATGKNTRLAAGISYGFRDDDEGGYVMEHKMNSINLELDKFIDEMVEKLEQMGEDRGISLKDIEYDYSNIEVGKDEYGCAIAVLVYLP